MNFFLSNISRDTYGAHCFVLLIIRGVGDHLLRASIASAELRASDSV
jgi:hypothetical protein